MRTLARAAWTLSLAIFAPLFATAPPAAQEHDGDLALTCDRDLIDPESYHLTTTAQAMSLLSPRYDFWDAFQINEHVGALHDLNLDARRLAERARERDPRNMMAHSILARQYTILNWQRAADETWRTVLNGGGTIVWTATL